MNENLSKETSASGQLNYFAHLGQAKRTYRSGWMQRGIDEPESIADHMYRMSMMAFLAPSHLDRSKCIEMCLIHDFPESIVGDLTPFDKATKEEKMDLENSAMSELTDMISENTTAKKHIQTLYEEYSAHASPEAIYVKSLDLFDMYLQAYEYELLYGKDFTEFFQTVPHFIGEKSNFEPQVKEWVKELMQIREQRVNFLPKDSNMNTILKDILNKRNQA